MKSINEYLNIDEKANEKMLEINEAQKFENPDENIVIYNGNRKCFAVIETSVYSTDHSTGVSSVTLYENSQLADIGFNDSEIKKIRKLDIGDTETNFDMEGLVVVRIN